MNRLTMISEPIVPAQAIYELWSVLTRRAEDNGIGTKVADADRTLDRCLEMVRLVPDPPGLFDRWRALCVEHDVKGKPSHDARIAAFTIETRATDLLTLNPADFKRFPVNLA